MSFSYDTALDTNLDCLRFFIRDTTSGAGPLPGNANFSDEELNALITLAGSWQIATVMALRAAAAQWSAKAGSLSIGDYSESRQQAQNLNALADKYESSAGGLPGAWTGMGLGASTASNIGKVT